ncbi:MAG TPA: YidB family protein [Thermoanaerobaculaceae bacterium]|jgi:uncharacterized protein YidB (DUF937 family)|nr:YidB family protein [Thermoanaerobaculaceae bacterium]
MGVLDGLLGQLGGLFGGGAQQKNVVNSVLEMLNKPGAGGLADIVKGFESSGLSQLVQSWISTGKNLPASAQQIEQGLGLEKIAVLAQSLGLTPDVLKIKLAEILPQVIDKLTPDGVVPKA